MAKAILTDAKVRQWLKENKGGKASLTDGAGLRLNISGDSVVWTLRYTSPVTKKAREMGLGKLATVGLATARTMADDARRLVAQRIDPLEQRKADALSALTFGQVADETFAVLRQEWTVADAQYRWDNAMSACSGVWNDSIRHMTPATVAAVLQKIKFPTQRRFVQLCMRRVFFTAIAKGAYVGHNPADANVVGKLVPMRYTGGHNAAMPWREVPAFVSSLQNHTAPSARALEFIILTGVRKREAIEATWDEFDLDAAVWTIPPERMKARREHKVPLVGRALELLRGQATLTLGQPLNAATAPVHGSASGYVWPGGGRKAAHLSHGAFVHIMPKGVTVHGFRSSMRTYFGDATNVSREVAELVLGHKVGDATERAYRREGDLERRRQALQLWHDFAIGACGASGNGAENVVEFRQVRNTA